MVKITVDCYEISVKMLVRKKDWDLTNKGIHKKDIADKIQTGIEVPLEDIEVIIR